MTLKTIRMNRKLTQARVAALLGVDRTTYTRLERGTRRLDVVMLAKLREELPLSDREVLALVTAPSTEELLGGNVSSAEAAP